jgi:radical SAM superfamily enzyme YgiQ (UPF0313 family)
MRIGLVQPAQTGGPGKGLRGRVFHVPPMALAVLASHTPPEIDVQVRDENVERAEFAQTPDLVGITSLTSTAPRAYELSRRFRQAGAKVVLGGIHVSAVPDEAASHADAVVVGEGESVWGQVVADARYGSLKKFYHAEKPDMETTPYPRRDVFDKKRYFLRSLVQTARGCPFDCDFCSVTRFFGKRLRFRPVPAVVEEVRRLKTKFITFVDDNITGDLTYARELFGALKPLNVRWICQTAMGIAYKPEVLKLAYESGCRGIFVGFESILPSNLREAGKSFNIVSKFKDAIRRVHDSGINVEGAFIFGFDHDDPDIFERTVDFALSAGIDFCQFGILTPFPGTLLYDKMESAGRIFDRDWSNYDVMHAVFRPQQMSPERLEEGARWAHREFYSVRSTITRVLSLGKRIQYLIPMLLLNSSYRAYIQRA